jgi:hypothetical protein
MQDWTGLRWDRHKIRVQIAGFGSMNRVMEPSKNFTTGPLLVARYFLPPYSLSHMHMPIARIMHKMHVRSS